MKYKSERNIHFVINGKIFFFPYSFDDIAHSQGVDCLLFSDFFLVLYSCIFLIVSVCFFLLSSFFIALCVFVFDNFCFSLLQFGCYFLGSMFMFPSFVFWLVPSNRRFQRNGAFFNLKSPFMAQ